MSEFTNLTSIFEMGITDITSREFFFTRDLIQYVIRIQTPDFEFDESFYIDGSNNSSFSGRIQQAVDFILQCKEEMLNESFKAFKFGSVASGLNNLNFMFLLKDMQLMYDKTVGLPEDVLPFCLMVSYFASLMYAKGAEQAPLAALNFLYYALLDMMKKSGISADQFWYEIGALNSEKIISNTERVGCV